jgi:hypothetical protein
VVCRQRLEGHAYPVHPGGTFAAVYFSPFHGIASDVGDILATDTNNAGPANTLMSQILRFLRECPGEVLIFRLRHKGNWRDDMWRTLFNLLGPHLIEVSDVRKSYSALRGRVLLSAEDQYGRPDPTPHNADVLQKYAQYVVRIDKSPASGAASVAGPYVDKGDANTAPWVNTNPDGIIRVISRWMMTNVDMKNQTKPGSMFNHECNITPGMVSSQISSHAQALMRCPVGITESASSKASVMNPYLVRFLRKEITGDNMGMYHTVWATRGSMIQTDFTPANLIWEIINLDAARVGDYDKW